MRILAGGRRRPARRRHDARAAADRGACARTAGRGAPGEPGGLAGAGRSRAGSARSPTASTSSARASTRASGSACGALVRRLRPALIHAHGARAGLPLAALAGRRADLQRPRLPFRRQGRARAPARDSRPSAAAAARADLTLFVCAARPRARRRGRDPPPLPPPPHDPERHRARRPAAGDRQRPTGAALGFLGRRSRQQEPAPAARGARRAARRGLSARGHRRWPADGRDARSAPRRSALRGPGRARRQPAARAALERLARGRRAADALALGGHAARRRSRRWRSACRCGERGRRPAGDHRGWPERRPDRGPRSRALRRRGPPADRRRRAGAPASSPARAQVVAERFSWAAAQAGLSRPLSRGAWRGHDRSLAQLRPADRPPVPRGRAALPPRARHRRRHTAPICSPARAVQPDCALHAVEAFPPNVALLERHGVAVVGPRSRARAAAVRRRDRSTW